MPNSIVIGIGLFIALVLVIIIASYYPYWSAAALPSADEIIVDKSKRTLSLLKADTIVKTYRISLGGNPIGHKQKEGDSRTPEGRYIIDWRNPNSRFFLSLHISYPDTNDTARAQRNGYNAGSHIMIHGVRNGLGWLGPLINIRDWTDGCIAVSNTAMVEIWNAVADGTPILITP